MLKSAERETVGSKPGMTPSRQRPHGHFTAEHVAKILMNDRRDNESTIVSETGGLYHEKEFDLVKS